MQADQHATDFLHEAASRLQSAAQPPPLPDDKEALQHTTRIFAEPWKLLVDAHLANLVSHHGIIQEMQKFASQRSMGAEPLLRELDAVHSRTTMMLEDARRACDAFEKYFGGDSSTSKASAAKPNQNGNSRYRPGRSPSVSSDGSEPSSFAGNPATAGPAQPKQKRNGGTTLYVSNLPSDVDRQHIEGIFSEHQAYVHSIVRRNGLAHAFIVVPSAEEARRVISKLNDTILFDHKVTVEFARKYSERQREKHNTNAPPSVSLADPSATSTIKLEPSLSAPVVEYDDITAEVDARLAENDNRRHATNRKRKRLSGDSVASNHTADSMEPPPVQPSRKKKKNYGGSSMPLGPTGANAMPVQDQTYGRLLPAGDMPHRSGKRRADKGYGVYAGASPGTKRIKVEPA